MKDPLDVRDNSWSNWYQEVPGRIGREAGPASTQTLDLVMASSVHEVPSEPDIQLHHGTDENSANDLLQQGVDQAQAAAFNVSGEFWATTSAADAETFAQVNPAGGVPARFSFSLPLWVLQSLLTSNPPRAYQHTTSGVDWYEFLPSSFPLLNQHVANREVVSPVP